MTMAATGYTPTPIALSSSSHTVCALHDILARSLATSRIRRVRVRVRVGVGVFGVGSPGPRVPAWKAAASVAACASDALRESERRSQWSPRASTAS